MKIRIGIVIDADRDSVWRAFDNSQNMRKWQPTLQSYSRKAGEDGQPGAVTELVHDENGRKLTLVETVTERREPDFMAGTRESAMGTAIVVNHFEALDDSHTRWTMYARHTFRGIYKIVALFLAGAMRRRDEQLMNNFKLFVESLQAGVDS